VIKGVTRHGDVDSLITLSDEQRHNTLRRSIANAFTAKTTLDYEPHIDGTIEVLLTALRREDVFDLGAKLAFFGLDAAAGFAFNNSKSCLAADADVDGMITLTRERARHWSRWASIPGTEALIYRNPIARMLKGSSPTGVGAAAISKLKERTGDEPLLKDDSELPDLLTRFLEAMEKNPETLDHVGIISLLMSTISGASDTTATAMTATMFHLLQNPATLAKLQQELETGDLSRPIPTFAQVSKLPYLHATIREGMRLFPPLAHPLERLVPVGGVEICGKFLPQGTSVGCLQLALHLNPKAFGEDAETFRPERWLEASPEVLRVMEASHLGFGRGRRVCLGQNLAVMEMKKVIPAMVTGFDVSFCVVIYCEDHILMKTCRLVSTTRMLDSKPIFRLRFFRPKSCG
jgi:cytochrome P450